VQSTIPRALQATVTPVYYRLSLSGSGSIEALDAEAGVPGDITAVRAIVHV
jgi:hypothetical protein